MKDGSIRVVLVEDNQVFREALELLLGLRDDIDVVSIVTPDHWHIKIAVEALEGTFPTTQRVKGLAWVRSPGVGVQLVERERPLLEDPQHDATDLTGGPEESDAHGERLRPRRRRPKGG